MADSESAEGALAAETSNLMVKAREILATPSHERAEIIVDQLSMGQETEEYQTALALFEFCTAQFPKCLTLKLLKVYRCSSSDESRFRSINLLSETLTELRNSRFEFSLDALEEIKPLLLTCLAMRETKDAEIKILRRIVSTVAYDSVKLKNGGWDDLSGLILSFAIIEPLKAFHVFLDLPPVYGKFIDSILDKLGEKIQKMLRNPEQDRAEDWSLALSTVAKLGIQVLHSELKSDLIKNKKDFVKKMCDVVRWSANNIVEKGMMQSLIRGLEDLEKFLSRDDNLYKYNKHQCLFVCSLAHKFREAGTTLTEEIVRKIIDRFVGKHSIDPAIKILLQPQENQDHDGDWFKHLNSLSSLEILRIFALRNVEERSREMAIVRLNFLLSQHTLKKSVINISVFKKLQPLLISCLQEERISDNMFKILGQVVQHVAYEIFVYHDEEWYGLREYIESKSQTEFERAVYIFQCLAMMPLDDEKVVIPVMEKLLPEISERLNPPREFSIDNTNSWVLAFTGAFCAAIHLLGIQSVKEIVYKMINSVKELVERGKEVGIVRRGFRDVESVVKKQLEWYVMIEYKFVKGLLWKLYDIKGMKMESRMVLWRINVILEKGLLKEVKELPRNELDWLEEDDDELDWQEEDDDA